jgi:hypothetical protein
MYCRLFSFLIIQKSWHRSRYGPKKALIRIIRSFVNNIKQLLLGYTEQSTTIAQYNTLEKSESKTLVLELYHRAANSISEPNPQSFLQKEKRVGIKAIIEGLTYSYLDHEEDGTLCIEIPFHVLLVESGLQFSRLRSYQHRKIHT